MVGKEEVNGQEKEDGPAKVMVSGWKVGMTRFYIEEKNTKT